MPETKREPMKHGEHVELGRYLGKSAASIRKMFARGKFDGLINPDRTYKKKAIKTKFPKLFNLKYQHNAQQQGRKKKASLSAYQPVKPPVTPPEKPEDVAGYLNETIQHLSELSEDELRKRNELEKLLMAQIKRKQAEGGLIESDKIEQAAFKAGLQIREGLEAIVERCSPLLAGESDAFQCKEILFREINFILEGLSIALSVSE